MRVFEQFLRLPRCGGASAHLEKTGFRMESIQNFACRPFSRGTENRIHEDSLKKPTWKFIEKRMHKHMRKTVKHLPTINRKSTKKGAWERPPNTTCNMQVNSWTHRIAYHLSFFVALGRQSGDCGCLVGQIGCDYTGREAMGRQHSSKGMELSS